MREESFLSAPLTHKDNEPKYHAMFLRAAEQAKTDPQYTLWFAATNTPDSQAQVVKLEYFYSRMFNAHVH